MLSMLISKMFEPEPEPISNADQAQQAIIAATSAGHLNQISSQALLANLNANTVPSTIGTQVQLLETTTPLVLCIVVDSTGSLAGFEDIIVKALNNTVGDFKLMRNKTGQEMYLCIIEFSNRGTGQYMRVIQDFIHVQDYCELTINDYQTAGRTPLNDATIDGITRTMAFGASTFAYGATGVQEVTIIITDGDDNDSQRTPADVAHFLVELNTKPNFVAAFVGVGNFPWMAVAKSMGFLDGNIVTVDKTATGIAKALKLYSSSVSSRSAASQAGKPVSSSGFFVNTP